MTTIGQLDKKVRIEKKGPAQNEWGEQLPDQWVSVCEPWANILHLSGLATIKAEAQTSIVRASIRIRYRTNVAPGMRVVHGTRIYDIKAGPLAVDGKREFIDLVCEEKT